MKVVALALVLAGCSGSSSDTPPIELPSRPVAETEPAPRYTAIDVESPGVVRGEVRWTGPLPELQPIPVPEGPQRAVCGESQPAPVFDPNAQGLLSNTVVWIDSITRGKRATPRAEPVLMDQVGCRYVPHLLAVLVGERVTFENSDAVMHNVHGTHGSREWINLGQPEANDASTETIYAPGVSRIVCDAGHPWMLGWVHAFDHPYFAVTGADGRFELTGVPPGEHTLRAWHEGVHVTGTSSGRPIYDEPYVVTQQITVAPSATLEVPIEVTAR